MIDLMTPRGRSLALRTLESRMHRLESDLEDRAQPLIRRVSEMDNRLLAAIGGGVLAVGVIALTAQFFLRSSAKETETRTVRSPRSATSQNSPRSASRASSNGRVHA